MSIDYVDGQVLKEEVVAIPVMEGTNGISYNREYRYIMSELLICAN